MSDLTITVDVACGKCGGALETKDDVRTPQFIVTCKECGSQIGTYAEIDAERRRRAHAKGLDLFRSAIQRGGRGLRR